MSAEQRAQYGGDEPRRGDGAAAKVLATPELLDHILQHLKSSLQLFVLQKVNSTFRDLIRDSPTLRQYFLIECPETGTYLSPGTLSIIPIFSGQLVKKIFYPMRIENMQPATYYDDPLLPDTEIRVRLASGWVEHNKMSPSVTIPGVASEPISQDASWRAIPPANDRWVQISSLLNGLGGWHTDVHMAGQRKGATLGVVVDYMRKMMQKAFGFGPNFSGWELESREASRYLPADYPMCLFRQEEVTEGSDGEKGKTAQAAFREYDFENLRGN
ncbi:hypothetical protein LTR56_017005 [Elasticomyces elasticus]|nr:hypothetical protein LTR56_017005 [Elasticomyces elasticus]KAK3636111.1 hypothetical protein LTR22_018869 [Elasticomyces elasticus]KAK4912120.1 hypothetical protein LTR49_019406 [Elasticomyces elasticus]KAK5753634.1 hypothetical protein LTS12_016271 [Elasticomyces elasticus]